MVDADPSVFALFQEVAKGLDLKLRHAATPEEAWRLMDAHEPLAVFADYRQRGEDGLSLLQHVGQKLPLVKRILHTGEPLPSLPPGHDIPVLGIPCDITGLRDLLQTLADLARPRSEAAPA